MLIWTPVTANNGSNHYKNGAYSSYFAPSSIKMSSLYCPLLFLGMVVLTSPAFAEFHKPPAPIYHRPPFEKPPPEYKPPTPVHKPPTIAPKVVRPPPN